MNSYFCDFSLSQAEIISYLEKPCSSFWTSKGVWDFRKVMKERQIDVPLLGLGPDEGLAANLSGALTAGWVLLVFQGTPW